MDAFYKAIIAMFKTIDVHIVPRKESKVSAESQAALVFPVTDPLSTSLRQQNINLDHAQVIEAGKELDYSCCINRPAHNHDRTNRTSLLSLLNRGSVAWSKDHCTASLATPREL